MSSIAGGDSAGSGDRWDDLEAQVVGTLGMDNVSMLDEAYTSFEKWTDTPAGIFTAFETLLAQANQKLSADQLLGDSLAIAKPILVSKIIEQVPIVLIEKLLPASGGISSLFKTIYWLARNGEELLSVGTSLVGQAQNLKDPAKVNEIAGVVTASLKKVTVVMLDFAAVQLNVAKLPADIARSLGKLHEQVQKRVQPLWTNVIQRGKDLLTPLTNTPAKENVARVTAGDLRGKIGKVHTVDRQAGQTHQRGSGLPFPPGMQRCQTNCLSPPFAL